MRLSDLPFRIDVKRAVELGTSVWTVACVQDGDLLLSLGRSRAAAVGAVSDTILDASRIVEDAIEHSDTGMLEHRSDIGSESGLRGLVERVCAAPSRLSSLLDGGRHGPPNRSTPNSSTARAAVHMAPVRAVWQKFVANARVGITPTGQAPLPLHRLGGDHLPLRPRPAPHSAPDRHLSGRAHHIHAGAGHGRLQLIQ